MNPEITVLLIEDDPAARAEMEACIEATENIQLVASTNNSDEALKYAKDLLPCVIILDLELHLGSGNGLFFMQQLRMKNLDMTPYILVTTHNTSSFTYKSARKLGADFIISKYQDDYSAQSVVDFLIMMSDIILNKVSQNASSKFIPESPLSKKQRIKKRVYTEINLVGINPKSIGYNYLAEAIQLLIDEPNTQYSTVIGQKYNKTNSSVERAMQNAINRAWRVSDIDDLEKHYTARLSSEKGCPTLTEFIYYYVNKIQNEY